jgi:hypothetical protein
MEISGFVNDLLGRYVPGIGKLDGSQGNYDAQGRFVKVSPGCSTNDPDHPHSFAAAVKMVWSL